ncbi:hypothetical protein ACIBO1_05570 [Micromonospora sp. NPDC049903]|uniref:hypothetical protein n=1 Tax=Micromonospora sp. NPDC049903 TaxID=3364276 RepID=UPI0037A335D7
MTVLTVSATTVGAAPSAHAGNVDSEALARSPMLDRLTTDADPARNTSSFTLTGTVVDESGTPAANAAWTFFLDSSQKNTASHKKSYLPVSGTYKLCGQGGYPTEVDKVKEVA